MGRDSAHSHGPANGVEAFILSSYSADGLTDAAAGRSALFACAAFGTGLAKTVGKFSAMPAGGELIARRGAMSVPRNVLG
jgi:hypothetical protein